MVVDARDVVDRVFRDEHGRIIAGLIRFAGDFDLAEESLQDAAAALDRWPRDGVPANPAAWLTVAAKRKAIDRARRERVRAGAAVPGEPPDHSPQEPAMPDDSAESAVDDDVLRLLFTFCHPALSTTTALPARGGRGDAWSGCDGRRLGVPGANGTSAGDAGAAPGTAAAPPTSAAPRGW
jgi:predicted RNA polymerase sigma factor